MSEPAPPRTSPSIRAGYDGWAAVYDRDANPLLALEEPLVRAVVGDVRGLAALDLGCGTGRHALWLARRERASPRSISRRACWPPPARSRAPRPSGSSMHDLHEPLPFASAAFDLVVSGLVLEHLRDLAAFFGEVRRVLRPGARAVVSAMHPAMLLRGSQARFTDPASGEVIQPGSFPHQLGDFVMAAVRAGLGLEGIDERAADADFATAYPRAAKYVGWPMVVVLALRA